MDYEIFMQLYSKAHEQAFSLIKKLAVHEIDLESAWITQGCDINYII